MNSNAAFWDRIAPKYAADPIKDMAAYEYTLNRSRSYLTGQENGLELGCGTGSTALLLAPGLRHLTATDISPAMIAIGRAKAEAAGVANVNFAVADAEAANPADTPFDVIFAFNLLHLTADPKAAIARIHGHLRPGGLFISKTACLSGLFRLMTVPVAVMRMFGRAPEVRFFSPRWLERAVAGAGFEIIESGDFPKRPARRYIVARRR
jgi:SAM-dependent methyltransferase